MASWYFEGYERRWGIPELNYSSDEDDDLLFDDDMILDDHHLASFLMPLFQAHEPRFLLKPKIQEPCKFFLMGSCNKGDLCRFSHDERKRAGLEAVSSTQSPQKTKEKDPSKILCKFFLEGSCFKGEFCEYSHVSLQTDTETSKLEDYPCSVCLENVIASKKQFGLLSGCNHVFCFPCISEWRKQTGNLQAKSCPMCRKMSHYIVPSPFFVTESGKKEIDDAYKRKLRSTPCKYWTKLDKKCPFGENCFYQHPGGAQSAPRRVNQRSDVFGY